MDADKKRRGQVVCTLARHLTGGAFAASDPRKQLQTDGAFSASDPRQQVQTVAATDGGDGLDVTFRDGAAFRFHALWLRDACRDDAFIAVKAGERILGQTQIVLGTSLDIRVVRSGVEDSGQVVRVEWDTQECGAFDSDMLRAYANVAAEQLAKPTLFPRLQNDVAKDISWLRPFLGLPDALAPRPSSLNLWKGPEGVTFKEFAWDHIMTPEGNLELLKTLFVDGVAKVYGAPSGGQDRLHEFANHCVGGLQKDPSRQEANWKIEKKLSAASISYNPDLKLNNHTDQSLPNHGIPGIFLVMHYAKGSGQQTLVDGVAVAEAMRVRHPEAFQLLASTNSDQERDLLASRQDANQKHTRSLKLTSSKPIFQLDTDGNVVRVQYNEVFRMPSTAAYHVFPKWYAAYVKFAEMIHSPEFERAIPMNSPDFLVINNWRVLHGRDGNRDGTPSGLQSTDRVLVGGTVTRETATSRARELAEQVGSFTLHGPHLLGVI